MISVTPLVAPCLHKATAKLNCPDSKEAAKGVKGPTLGIADLPLYPIPMVQPVTG